MSEQEVEIYKSWEIDKLKEYLAGNKISFKPNTQEEIDKKKKELGGLPAILEEYYLKIGYFPEISDSGMGCHVDDLDDIFIMTAEELREDCEDAENEVDDYLVFGRESVSVDEFGIRVKDFGESNPTIYSMWDLYEVNAEGSGLVCGLIAEIPAFSNFLGLVHESVEEIC